MGDTNTYPNLSETSPIGQPLDWTWPRGVCSDWGEMIASVKHDGVLVGVEIE
ncbi:MAG: hypothetical protein ACYCS7_14485 [Acidimicrobiales bacterium]